MMMKIYDAAEHALQQGDEYPYHNKAAVNNAERIALAILYDLNDRSGIKRGFRDIDVPGREEIVAALAAIVRAGIESAAKTQPQVGETWWCKLGRNIYLTKLKPEKFTGKLCWVALWNAEFDDYVSDVCPIKIEDLEFVEKAE